MVSKVGIFIIVILLLTFFSLNFYENERSFERSSVLTDANNQKTRNFKNLDIPENYDLKQFDGMTLNFIVENNLYANILSHESEQFSEVTGINVKIKAMDFDTLVKKVNLDFISQSGKYQIVYVDPYQTLNRFYNYLEVLNNYNLDPDSPKIKGFIDDFFENQKYVCSYFKGDKNVYTVPFDSTTMILYYRKDIFDKYRDKFLEEMNYDWTPGTTSFTWERYVEVAKWIDENVPDEEVKYGSGHMAQEHNSIFCDFSNILASYGGDYFSDENINTLGVESFKKINVIDKNFIKALDMYKKVVRVAAPESINWNWTDTSSAFRNGEIAMMPNWDENYSYMEHDLQSKVRGKVGYSILPYGDERSANIYGGSGIGINKYATDREKKAAWLYIVWATSRDMQLKVLKHPEGGSLPTRKSAYQEFDIKHDTKNKNDKELGSIYLKHVTAVIDAWKTQNLYLRPKISNFYQVEKIIIHNLHEMIENDMDSVETSKKIFFELNNIKRSKKNFVEENKW